MNSPNKPIIVVIGGGLMGCGIGFVFAYGGYQVRIFEPNETQRRIIPSRIDDIGALLEVGKDKLGDIELPQSLELSSLMLISLKKSKKY